MRGINGKAIQCIFSDGRLRTTVVEGKEAKWSDRLVATLSTEHSKPDSLSQHVCPDCKVAVHGSRFEENEPMVSHEHTVNTMFRVRIEVVINF